MTTNTDEPLTTPDPTLSQLIHMRRGHRSYQRLSQDCGGTPSMKAIHYLAAQVPKGFPNKATLEGLSLGLNVPLTEVVLAAARSLEMNVHSTVDPESLVLAGAAALPYKVQESIFTISRELQLAFRGASEQES